MLSETYMEWLVGVWSRIYRKGILVYEVELHGPLLVRSIVSPLPSSFPLIGQ